MKWIGRLLSDGSEVSSRRLLAFLTFILFTIQLAAYVFAGVPIDSNMIWASSSIIVSLVLGIALKRGGGYGSSERL